MFCIFQQHGKALCAQAAGARQDIHIGSAAYAWAVAIQ